MSQNFITEWLIGEAGAAWIIGVLGILGAAYTWLRRERPVRIIVQELSHTRLLDIHPAQRDSLLVSYKTSDGKEAPITDLHQTTFAIYNSGTRDITESLLIKLLLEFADSDQHVNTWDAVIDHGSWRLIGGEESKTEEVEISLPFLNSFRAHKHYVYLYIISERRLNIDLLAPVGKGWSAMLISLTDQGHVGAIKRRIERINTTIVYILLLFAVALFAFAAYYPPASLDFPVKWMLYGINAQEIDVAVASYKSRLEALSQGDWEIFLGASSMEYAFYCIVALIFAFFMVLARHGISRFIRREMWGVETQAVFSRLDKAAGKRRKHSNT